MLNKFQEDKKRATEKAEWYISTHGMSLLNVHLLNEGVLFKIFTLLQCVFFNSDFVTKDLQQLLKAFDSVSDTGPPSVTSLTTPLTLCVIGFWVGFFCHNIF